MSLNPIAENYKLAAANYETGKFTRLLLPRLAARAKLIAVEPVAEMAAKLARLPGVSIIHSTVSDTRLTAGVADLVTCAQAFHWFDDEATVAEITRTLRQNGTLAFIWNLLDQRAPRGDALFQLIGSYAGSTPRPQTERWRWILSDRRFRFDREVTACNLHVVSPRALFARVFSTSYLARLPEIEQRGIGAQVDDILRAHGLQGSAGITVPYRTHLYLLCWRQCCRHPRHYFEICSSRRFVVLGPNMPMSMQTTTINSHTKR